MKIEKIKIENFKSIKGLEFDIKKYGDSYTTMLVGLNESGKSNILEAMSFFNVPNGEYDFLDYCHQKHQEEEYVDIYFYLSFVNKNTYLKPIQDKIGKTGKLLDFEITEIVKRISLKNDSKKFQVSYDYIFNLISTNLFFVRTEKNGEIILAKQNDVTNSFVALTEGNFRYFFSDIIVATIKKHEPSTIFWEPSDVYLISEADLNTFSEDTNSNKALNNIFLLAGYENAYLIKKAVENIQNPTQRSRLMSTLKKSLNDYLKKVWKHDIEVVIEITETAKFTLMIKDIGSDNEHDRFTLSSRSEGARHFLSLILSLSIENNKKKRRDQLILIDEPEAHLHPSGIRDISKELLEIGKDNFVFIATHSPFLIDKQNRKRNIIIKKNKQATTEKREIKEHENFIDDEVLREAFGIDVYKDLLNPHSVLVEGESDKVILQKALTIKGIRNISVANGHGNNLDTLASKLNDSDIELLVIVDDDKDGKRTQKKIVEIGGSYSKKNVCTIRDMVGDIVADGTMEDTLEKKYIESMFKQLYKDSYEKEAYLSLNDDVPVITQIKTFLKDKQKDQKKDANNNFVFKLKKKISDELELNKTNLQEHQLLDELVKKIKEKLTV